MDPLRSRYSDETPAETQTPQCDCHVRSNFSIPVRSSVSAATWFARVARPADRLAARVGAFAGSDGLLLAVVVVPLKYARIRAGR
jgi:hypothetical protein